MALKLTALYTDPKTGAELPAAFLRVTDAEVHLKAGIATVVGAIYASPETEAAHLEPVAEVTIALSPAEIEALRPQFAASLYTLLAQRPEFTGSSVE